MTSDKTGVYLLSKILVDKGITQLVYSPGSRNAPLAIAFSREPGIESIQIVDERSAAFFALGLAMQSGKPVAIACTSGSAVLNYAPAIAEAYYSEIPLLILTADRPAEWIDQDESQTIRQKEIYRNFILGSFELPAHHTPAESWQHSRIINEAVNLCQFPRRGPVHINIPLGEPLYGMQEKPAVAPRLITRVETETRLSSQAIESLRSSWKSYSKKLIIVGSMPPDAALQQALQSLAKDESLVILTENTSNLQGDSFFEGIDKLIDGLHPDHQQEFAPDLLVSIGKRLVSRKIKAWLRKQTNMVHWQIDESGQTIDSYQHLTHIFPVPSIHFLACLEGLEQKDGNYRKRWQERMQFTSLKHQQFLQEAAFSDLKVFHNLLAGLPKNSVIHAGNSTPIRYLQLFDKADSMEYYSNRGTSGIDGSVSTAAGFAYNSPKTVFLISGDLGFFYDSNGIWNHYLKPSFKIILINNGGGGIFRIIEGPSRLPEMEQFFETSHQTKARGIAEAFGLRYFAAHEQEEFNQILPSFLHESEKASLLEIFTDSAINASVLKSYFNSLKQTE